METKTVLITGAAKRVGRAIALDLARHGWNIAVHYNSSEKDAHATADDIRKLGVQAKIFGAELSDESQTATLIDQCAGELGPPTALVNSASLFENDNWQSATRGSWDRHMAVNLRAPFVLSQQFTKHLPQGSKGAIVNLLDQRLFNPAPDFMSYGVSRAGLGWLTVTLAQALAPRIRVNGVAPGPTLKAARQSVAHFEHEQSSTILGHGSEPQDICDAVGYLLGANAVTGQILTVDGGQHLMWHLPETKP